MSEKFRRKENGEAEMIFMQHYASSSNDYIRSQQSQQSSGDLSYSANGSNNLQQMKTFTEGESPNPRPSQFQSPSTNKSPYNGPIMTYTGQKDGFVYHNRAEGSTVASAAQSRYGGTLQYSGGLMNSNDNSNRLLQNFLTESRVSPLSTTAGKNYRHMEDDQLLMNGEIMGMSLQSTDLNARRNSDSKERAKEKISDYMFSKQAPNLNINPYNDGRQRQQIISVLPGNHDDTNKISEQSGHFGQQTKQPPRHGRVQTAIGIDYSDNASSPLRYLQQRNGFERSDNSGFTNKTVSPYAGMDQLKQALLASDPRHHKKHSSNELQNNNWLDKARHQSQDRGQKHEQEMLDQRLRKIQAHAANQMKHQIKSLNHLPKTIIDEPSVHSQQPSMSASQSEDKLETNSLIELEDQINRKKERVFKKIEKQCSQPTRNDSGFRQSQEKRELVVNQTNMLQPQNKLIQAIVADPGCFYQDKLTALRQKIQTIQNRQTAVNQSHISNTNNHQSINRSRGRVEEGQYTINRSHILGTSKVQFDPLNFQAMEAGTSPFRSSAISPTRQHTLHTSLDMSRGLHNMGTVRSDANGEQEFQFFSVNQIEPLNPAEEHQNAGQKSDIRQKIQNLKDNLNKPLQKPPLKNENQVSNQVSILDIQNSRTGKRSAPTKMPIRTRSVCTPIIDSQNISFIKVIPQVVASMNTSQTTRKTSEKQINIDIQGSSAKRPIQSSLRVKRPSSVASNKNQYEPIEPVKAVKRQKSKDQQDRIRGLIAERKKNKVVMEELQLQIESLNERMSQAEKKSFQNAHYGKHKIKELITEINNLQDIVVKYKKKEVKLKKKINDEVGLVKPFKKKRMSQTIQKPVSQHIEIDQGRHFKTISTEQKTKKSKYVPIMRKSYDSQSIPNRSPVSPKYKCHVKSAAQFNPYAISIHSKSHSISPVNKNLMKQLGQSELALRRECCQKALAQNLQNVHVQSKSRSRSVERKHPVTDQDDSHIVIKKITSNTNPTLAKTTSQLLQQNAKQQIFTNPSLISNTDKPQSAQVDSNKKQPNKAQRERQRQPNSQRKQSLQAIHKDLAHKDPTNNGLVRSELDQDVMTLTLTAKEMQQQELIETLQEQLQNAKAEKEEWKHKSKKLAFTFLETLRGLKENLFAVRDEAQNDLAIAKDHFEQRLDYIGHLVNQSRNPWENNLGSTEKMPTQLSPRIRGDSSKDFSKSQKRVPQKVSNEDLQLDDSPYHKPVLLLNQESSNSNFHQVISHSIEVSEKQLMHRNILEKNTFEEPDFA